MPGSIPCPRASGHSADPDQVPHAGPGPHPQHELARPGRRARPAERATTRQQRIRSPPIGIGDGNGHGDSSIHRSRTSVTRNRGAAPQRPALELDRLAVLPADLDRGRLPPAEHARRNAVHGQHIPSPEPGPATAPPGGAGASPTPPTGLAAIEQMFDRVQ